MGVASSVAVGVAGGGVGVGVAGGGVGLASSVAVGTTGEGVGVTSVVVGVGVGGSGEGIGVASSGRPQAESNVNSSKPHKMTLAFIAVLLLGLFYISLPYLASEGFGLRFTLHVLRPEVAKSFSLW